MGRIISIDTRIDNGVEVGDWVRGIAGVVEDVRVRMGRDGPIITLTGRDVISAKLDTNYHRAYADYDDTADTDGANELSSLNIGLTLVELIQDLVNIGDQAFGVDIMNEDISSTPQGDDLTPTETFLWGVNLVPQYIDTGDSRLLNVVSSICDNYGMEIWRSYDAPDFRDYGSYLAPRGSGRYGSLRTGRWNYGGGSVDHTFLGPDHATPGEENTVSIVLAENRLNAVSQVVLATDGQGVTSSLLTGGDVGPGAHPSFQHPPENYSLQMSLPLATSLVGANQFSYFDAGKVFQQDPIINAGTGDPTNVPDDSFYAEDVAVMPNGDFVVAFDGTTLKSWAWDKVSNLWGAEADSITVATTPNNVIFNFTGDHVALVSDGTPFITVYPINLTTGVFGAKASDPATLPAGLGHGVAWSHDELHIAVAHTSSPYITVYPWTNGTSTFGAKVADPSDLTGMRAGIWPAFSGPDDAIVVTNDPLIGGTQPPIAGWPWTGSFGTRYADPPKLDNVGDDFTLGGGWCEFRNLSAGPQLIAMQGTTDDRVVAMEFILFNSTSGFEQSSAGGAFEGRDQVTPFLAPWTTYSGDNPEANKSGWFGTDGVVMAYRSNTAAGNVGALVTYYAVSGTRIDTAVPDRSPAPFFGAKAAVPHPDGTAVFICGINDPASADVTLSPYVLNMELPTQYNGGPGKMRWFRENSERFGVEVQLVNDNSISISDIFVCDDPLRTGLTVNAPFVVDAISYRCTARGELTVTVSGLTADVVAAINRNSR